MKARLTSLLLALALLGLFAVPASSTVAQEETTSANSFTNIPVTGAFDGGRFTGVLNITEFAVDDRPGRGRDSLVARGVLSGTLTGDDGAVIGNVAGEAVELPVRVGGLRESDGDDDDAVAAQQASCQILRLVLGPLDLNLLGLRVQLNQVVLNITAVPGPGNLLGNLLCAIANLLNPRTPLTDIAALLNALIPLLGTVQ